MFAKFLLILLNKGLLILSYIYKTKNSRRKKMKSAITLIALLIFSTSNLSFASIKDDRERIENGVRIFPQTNAPVLNTTVPQSEIDREANPAPTAVDNSQSTKDWAKIVEARKSGNEELYFRLTHEYTQKYPDHFYSSGNTFNAPQDVPVNESKQIPFETDWISSGDNLVSAGSIPNPGIFERNLRLRIDSLGTQYVGYITGNRDTLRIARSTNNGQNWELWRSILPGGTSKWHSFDMFITDTTGSHVLGFIACRTPSTSSFEGQAYYFHYREDGSFGGATLITPTTAGRGHLSPSIVSDGRDWSPGATYWYVVFRNVNGTTGVGDSAVVSYSTNWGQAWSTPRRVRAFNDYDLSINYNYRADSIYVLLTNALTASNPNFRLMRISLGNLTGGGTPSWTQFNVASTSDPEKLGQLAVNRNNNDMAIVYTRTVGGSDKVYYDYMTSSNYWGSATPIFNQPQVQSIAAIDCNIGQWAWRMCYQVNAPSLDTIVYMSATNIASGWAGRTVVNQNDPTRTVAPSIAGYRTPGNGGGVAFVGFGASPIFYDNSSIVTNITLTGNETPEAYSLSQNFPNPFNPETQINFTLPNSGLVKLVVYDILGKEVATLLNDSRTAGSYTINFNADKLTSGVYFYKLTSGEFSDVKRMVLLK